MTIKFLWNGIKVDGELFKGWWSDCKLEGFPAGTITFYVDGYKWIPRECGFEVENDSDIMTDYFDNDTVRIRPGSAWHCKAAEAVRKYKVHECKMNLKSLEKAAERYRKHGLHSYAESYAQSIDRVKAKLAELTA